MLTRIARFATARPRSILAGALLIMLLCGAFGATVQSHLKAGGFITSDLESAKADRYLQDHFPGGNPNYVALVTTADGVDSAAARSAALRVIKQLEQRSTVSGIQSYWTVGRPDLAQALRSKDGTSGLILVSIRGDDTQAQAAAGAISDEITGTTVDGVAIRAGGLTAAFHDINKQVTKDLLIAEAIAIPLSLLALVLVFGSLVAASIPVGIGVFAIAATLGILRLFTLVTDVSVFALNLTTALGLALAIDYSLFIVSRYREELARGLDTRAAVVRAVQTAGRTVLFSALTVALSLAALAVFQQFFLKSFAYAGIAVVAAAAAAAILVLPAGLVLLGDRVNALDLRVPLLRLIHRTPATPPRPQDSRWYRFVTAVMKRAVPVAIVTTIFLLLLGSPFLNVKFSYPDDQVLPKSVASRMVGDVLRADFNADIGSSTAAVLPGYHGSEAAIGGYAAALSMVPDVPAVLSSAGVYINGSKLAAAPPTMASDAGTYLSIATSIDPYSTAGSDQLAALRAVPPPGPVLFGGSAAVNQDSIDSMTARLPYAAAIIVIATLIVLFLFTGSLLLPVKALVLNVLSLTATFGAMVWIFQDGHLSGLLGFTPTGYLNAAMPILMFCLAFGMSMDYEVFLLSRIREEWLASDRGPTANTHSVAMGVARTGRIYTAAAGLMAIVLGAMIGSRVSFMQMFGVGLALAIVVDAAIIRTALVPAVMRMLGTANWWAPKSLAALHDRIGLEEAPSTEPDAQAAGHAEEHSST